MISKSKVEGFWKRIWLDCNCNSTEHAIRFDLDASDKYCKELIISFVSDLLYAQYSTWHPFRTILIRLKTAIRIVFNKPVDLNHDTVIPFDIAKKLCHELLSSMEELDKLKHKTLEEVYENISRDACSE